MRKATHCVSKMREEFVLPGTSDDISEIEMRETTHALVSHLLADGAMIFTIGERDSNIHVSNGGRSRGAER